MGDTLGTDCQRQVAGILAGTADNPEHWEFRSLGGRWEGVQGIQADTGTAVREEVGIAPVGIVLGTGHTGDGMGTIGMMGRGAFEAELLGESGWMAGVKVVVFLGNCGVALEWGEGVLG